MAEYTSSTCLFRLWVADVLFNPDIDMQDIILQIIGDIGVAGATYRSMEFAGSALGQLSMEERQTL